MSLVIVPAMLVCVAVVLQVRWAIKADSAIQWALVAISILTGAVAILLLIRMALGAWPTYAAFIFAAASIIIAGVQGLHYLLSR